MAKNEIVVTYFIFWALVRNPCKDFGKPTIEALLFSFLNRESKFDSNKNTKTSPNLWPKTQILVNIFEGGGFANIVISALINHSFQEFGNDILRPCLKTTKHRPIYCQKLNFGIYIFRGGGFAYIVISTLINHSFPNFGNDKLALCQKKKITQFISKKRFFGSLICFWDSNQTSMPRSRKPTIEAISFTFLLNKSKFDPQKRKKSPHVLPKTKYW